MPEPRRLREYWLDISVQLTAHDADEVRDIAKYLVERIKSGDYKVEAEATTIEEA